MRTHTWLCRQALWCRQVPAVSRSPVVAQDKHQQPLGPQAHKPPLLPPPPPRWGDTSQALGTGGLHPRHSCGGRCLPNPKPTSSKTEEIRFATFQAVSIFLMLRGQAWHATHAAFPAVTCWAPLPPFPSLLTNLAPCRAAVAQADPHRALPAMQLAWLVPSCPLHACARGRVLPAALWKGRGSSRAASRHQGEEQQGNPAERVVARPPFACRPAPEECGEPKLMLPASRSPRPFPIISVHRGTNTSPVKGTEAKPSVSAPPTPDCPIFLSGKREVTCLNLHVRVNRGTSPRGSAVWCLVRKKGREVHMIKSSGLAGCMVRVQNNFQRLKPVRNEEK